MKKFALSLGLSFIFSAAVFNTAYAADVVQYLVVGGGGTGGGLNAPGGGGGQVLIGTTTISTQSYPIVVGGSDTNSSAIGFTALAGTVGTSGNGNVAGANGANSGGGGGGDGGIGGAGGSGIGGNGGPGTLSSISGTAVTYGGGGGGEGQNQGGIGSNGGGNGGTQSLPNGGGGAANTGAGGGSAYGGGVGGPGGSGIVIISYPTDSFSATGGTVTTDGIGNTVHTFTSNGTFIVTSTSTVVHVTGVSLNETTHSLYPNGTDQLTASVSPSNATDQSVAFSSNNPSIATVNSTGLITAVAVGSAIVTVTTTDGGFTATDTISVVPVSTTVNRVAKFVLTSPQTIGDSLLSDDGSNVTLTSGNFFLQAGSLIDSIASGTLSFGATNASSLLFGHSGSNSIFNGNLGIGTSTPGTVFSIGGVANFSSATTTFYGSGINLSGGCFAVNGVCVGSNVIDTAHGGTASTTPLGGILVGNGTNPVKSLSIGTGLAFDGSTLSLSTNPNCSSATSPASCGSAPSGSVALATGISTLVVNTSAVTANSQIFVIQDSSLGSRLGVTCNTVTNRVYSINARVPGVSFTIKSSANPTGTPACLSYWINN